MTTRRIATSKSAFPETFFSTNMVCTVPSIDLDDAAACGLVRPRFHTFSSKSTGFGLWDRYSVRDVHPLHLTLLRSPQLLVSCRNVARGGPRRDARPRRLDAVRVAAVLAPPHLRRRLRHRRLLRVGHLQRRTAGTCPGRAADSAWPAPAWTNQLCSGLPLAGVAMDPIGLGPFALSRPPRRSTSSSSCCCSSPRTAPTDSPAASAPTGPAPSSRASRSPARLHRVSVEAPGDRLDGRLAPGGTAVARSRARGAPTRIASRRSHGGIRPGLRRAGALRFPQSIYICASSTACSRCSAPSAIGTRWVRARWACCSAASLSHRLGAAAGAIVLLPLSKLGTISDRPRRSAGRGRRAWPTGRRTS